MEPNFIAVNRMTIAYYEKNSRFSKSLVFIHGNSCSSKMWQKQFESESLNQYRLIAIDLPGNGRSDTSKNPNEDYSPTGTAQILAQVVRQLTENRLFILIGFSYGSNLIAEMLMNKIKPCGIVLLGACVLGEGFGMEKVFASRTTPLIFTYNESDRKIVEKFFLESMDSSNREDMLNSIDDYLNVDPGFKPNIFRSAAEGKITDEIKNLKILNVPVCVIFGAEDSLINSSYLDCQPFPVWKNRICKINGAGHWVNLDKANVVNSILLEYAEEQFKANHS